METPKRTLKFVGYTSPCNVDFILQGEFVEDDNGAYIVAVDVLVAPWGLRGNFISRWRWLESVYKQGMWPFSLQKWLSIDDVRILGMIAMAKEGIVVQQLNAVSGIVKEGRGSAMYVKRVKTVDVMINGVICEVECSSNKILRQRPDKKRPNPPFVIQKVGTAVDYYDFALLMRFKFDAPCKNSLESLVWNIANFVPLCEWTKLEKIHFHFSQYNPVLEALDPKYLAILRMEFAHTCSLAKISKEVDEIAEIEFDDGVSDYIADDIVVDVTKEYNSLGELTAVPFVTLTDILYWKEHNIARLHRYMPLIAKELHYHELAREWYANKDRLLREYKENYGEIIIPKHGRGHFH